MTLSFHRFAEHELLDAVRRYEEQAPGLGGEFLTIVEEALQLLDRHPKAAPLVKGEARRLVLRRFPYNIIYSLPVGELRVLAIAHQSRSPTYWIERR